MRIEPVENKFGKPIPKPIPFGHKIYKETIKTSYGKCIRGNSRGYNYDVHVAIDKRTKNIIHKLYCVTKENKWVKSFLRYFSGNKLHKEIRSVNTKLDITSNR